MQSKNAEKEKQPQRELTTSDWQRMERNNSATSTPNANKQKSKTKLKHTHTHKHRYTNTHTHTPSTHKNWFCWSYWGMCVDLYIVWGLFDWSCCSKCWYYLYFSIVIRMAGSIQKQSFAQKNIHSYGSMISHQNSVKFEWRQQQHHNTKTTIPALEIEELISIFPVCLFSLTFSLFFFFCC